MYILQPVAEAAADTVTTCLGLCLLRLHKTIVEKQQMCIDDCLYKLSNNENKRNPEQRASKQKRQQSHILFKKFRF